MNILEWVKTPFTPKRQNDKFAQVERFQVPQIHEVCRGLTDYIDPLPNSFFMIHKGDLRGVAFNIYFTDIKYDDIQSQIVFENLYVDVVDNHFNIEYYEQELNDIAMRIVQQFGQFAISVAIEKAESVVLREEVNNS